MSTRGYHDEEGWTFDVEAKTRQKAERELADRCDRLYGAGSWKVRSSTSRPVNMGMFWDRWRWRITGRVEPVAAGGVGETP